MMNGRNNGKKLMAVRIVAHAFEIVRLPESSIRNKDEFVALANIVG
jgi:ribosomal protein S7